MEKRGQRRFIVLAGLSLASVLMVAVVGHSQDGRIKSPVPEGVYIELTKEFYEALKEESHGGTKVYSGNPSTEYLKQIAVSSKYMVETNLQILKKQDKIIQLLQNLVEKRKK